MRLRHASTSGLSDHEGAVISGGAAYLHAVERRLAPYVERATLRPRVMASVQGLLSPAERRRSGQLADGGGGTCRPNRRPLGWQGQGQRMSGGTGGSAR